MPGCSRTHKSPICIVQYSHAFFHTLLTPGLHNQVEKQVETHEEPLYNLALAHCTPWFLPPCLGHWFSVQLTGLHERTWSGWPSRGKPHTSPILFTWPCGAQCHMLSSSQQTPHAVPLCVLVFSPTNCHAQNSISVHPRPFLKPHCDLASSLSATVCRPCCKMQANTLPITSNRLIPLLSSSFVKFTSQWGSLQNQTFR